MDRVRHLLQALLAGLFAGLTAVALLPFRDVGGVGAMIRHDSGGWLALAMLAWGFGTTFGLAAAAGALADDKGKG